jgi:hypothetical protein
MTRLIVNPSALLLRQWREHYMNQARTVPVNRSYWVARARRANVCMVRTLVQP